MGLRPVSSAPSAASEWLAMGLRQMLERPVSYYEGPYPGPGTEMLAIGVEVSAQRPTSCVGEQRSPQRQVQDIKLYLQWHDGGRFVMFTVRVKSASGTWMLSSILEDLPGFTVTIDIDQENDTAMVVANCQAMGALMETKLSGELDWPIYLPPSGRPSSWPAPPPYQELNLILWRGDSVQRPGSASTRAAPSLDPPHRRYGRIPPPITAECPECGAFWTRSDLNHPWHTRGSLCTVCDVHLPFDDHTDEGAAGQGPRWGAGRRQTAATPPSGFAL